MKLQKKYICKKCETEFTEREGNFPAYKGKTNYSEFIRYKQHCNTCEQKKIDAMMLKIEKSKYKTKFCSGCDTEKPKQDFYFNDNLTFSCYCKGCTIRISTEHQKNFKTIIRKSKKVIILDKQPKLHPAYNQLTYNNPKFKVKYA